MNFIDIIANNTSLMPKSMISYHRNHRYNFIDVIGTDTPHKLKSMISCHRNHRYHCIYVADIEGTDAPLTPQHRDSMIQVAVARTTAALRTEAEADLKRLREESVRRRDEADAELETDTGDSSAKRHGVPPLSCLPGQTAVGQTRASEKDVSVSRRLFHPPPTHKRSPGTANTLAHVRAGASAMVNTRSLGKATPAIAGGPPQGGTFMDAMKLPVAHFSSKSKEDTTPQTTPQVCISRARAVVQRTPLRIPLRKSAHCGADVHWGPCLRVRACEYVILRASARAHTHENAHKRMLDV